MTHLIQGKHICFWLVLVWSWSWSWYGPVHVMHREQKQQQLDIQVKSSFALWSYNVSSCQMNECCCIKTIERVSFRLANVSQLSQSAAGSHDLGAFPTKSERLYFVNERMIRLPSAYRQASFTTLFYI